jgi:hypothetical protein
MSSEPRRIPLSELSANLARIIELVLASEEPIVVEREDGWSVSINSVTPASKSAEDFAEFMAAAGSWSDVDTDKLLDDVYTSRELLTRPYLSL